MSAVVYNSNQDLEIDGQMMLAIGGEPVAFATSAKMTVNTDMVDTTNMMSGNWKSSIAGAKSFTTASEALLTYKNGATSASSLLKSQINDALLDFVFGSYKRSGDEVTGFSYALDTTKDHYTGKIHITTMELNGDASSKLKKYSMSAEGSGPLTPVDGVPAA